MLEAGTTCWRVEPAPRVAVLVDMEPYLAAAKTAMSNATHTIHFLNWAFDPDTILDREPSGPGSTQQAIGPFLRDLAAARPELEIRILCWQSALPVAATQRFFPLRSRTFFAGSSVDFQLDGSLPLGAAHHQKVIIIDDVLAFCGSCDIGPDRWDTAEHRCPDPRRAKKAGGEACYDCRHEVMAMVDGAPAASLGALFRERWERATGTSIAAPKGGHADVWPDHVVPDFTDASIGLSRTQAPWKNFPERREGEASILAAIAGAKSSIYLENQYFTSPIVAEALAQRLEERDGPEVVLICTERSPSWFDQMTMDKTRSKFLDRLGDADQHGRLYAYSPATQNGQTIIVHAKLAIIDDRYIRLGSSNINNRSEGFDTECDLTIDALAANAGEGPRCVSAFRDRLLAHWLGCSEQEVAEAPGHGIGARVEALRIAGYDRLKPLRSQRLGVVSNLIATYHLGDPISAADSLRPWKRRAQMRLKMAEAVTRLKNDAVPSPVANLPKT